MSRSRNRRRSRSKSRSRNRRRSRAGDGKEKGNKKEEKKCDSKLAQLFKEIKWLKIKLLSPWLISKGSLWYNF